MVYNATFNNIQLYRARGGHFYWWRNLGYMEKTTKKESVVSPKV